MKTLMISDLTVSTELDSKAMTAVSGGVYWRGWGPSYSYNKRTDIDVTKFDANQFIGQEQNVFTSTGINTAFAENLRSDVYSDQDAQNNINFR